MRPVSKRIAWLCLWLMLWSAIAFAVHHHADGEEPATCPICIVAHSASPTALVIVPQITWLAVSIVRTEPVEAAKQRLIAFALTVRPPPAI